MPDPVQAILAFDFGFKRIGIACGDTLTRSAAPRAASQARNGEPDWTDLAKHIKALQPKLLVVGEPYNADGTPSSIAPAVRAFGAELERRFGLPVKWVDERWSSLEATEALKAQRASGERKRRVTREDIDSAAAAVILNRWFMETGDE
ncbi:MAG TPA: Holliday junction resolvase RuvX [Steroidobacteraceae bacterium]|jgi:putative Holliday junction resolvase